MQYILLKPVQSSTTVYNWSIVSSNIICLRFPNGLLPDNMAYGYNNQYIEGGGYTMLKKARPSNK